MPPTIDSRLLILVCAVLETGTGLALLAFPRWVVRLLLGAELQGAGPAAGRLCGVALMSLGLACWPERAATPDRLDRRANRALLVYNASVAAYLAGLLALGGDRGILLLPAIALHAVLTAVLARIVMRSRTLNENA